MQLVIDAWHFIATIDAQLAAFVAHYGAWVYSILFLIIFCETGLVATPFLPGDSLLFAAGALAAVGSLNIFVLFIVLVVAAILGDTVNYAVGRFVGKKILAHEHRWLNRGHLERARKFYEKYGGKTIALARFMPIIRTFAPFVAGVGEMPYRQFFYFNVIGGVAWVAIFLGSGYLFGNVPAVKYNFSLVILVIILISILPALIEYIKHHLSTKKQNAP